MRTIIALCNTMVPTTNASACKLGYALRASSAQATRQGAAIVEKKLPGEMMMAGEMDERVAITWVVIVLADASAYEN